MKRNNMFMLSYIIFIFIAFVVKLCWDFPMWAPIVTAITIASCIFSCADITNAVDVEYSKDVEDFTPLLDTAMEKCNHIEKFYAEHKRELTQMSKCGNHFAEILCEGPEVIDDTKSQLVKIVKGLKLKKTLSIICKYATCPLVVIAFLSFFCTITFGTLNELLMPIQEYLTVFAFGVMMLTQYFGNRVKEEHIDLINNYNDVNSLLDSINELLTKSSTTFEQEITINAD